MTWMLVWVGLDVASSRQTLDHQCHGTPTKRVLCRRPVQRWFGDLRVWLHTRISIRCAGKVNTPQSIAPVCRTEAQDGSPFYLGLFALSRLSAAISVVLVRNQLHGQTPFSSLPRLSRSIVDPRGEGEYPTTPIGTLCCILFMGRKLHDRRALCGKTCRGN